MNVMAHGLEFGQGKAKASSWGNVVNHHGSMERKMFFFRGIYETYHTG